MKIFITRLMMIKATVEKKDATRIITLLNNDNQAKLKDVKLINYSDKDEERFKIITLNKNILSITDTLHGDTFETDFDNSDFDVLTFLSKYNRLYLFTKI